MKKVNFLLTIALFRSLIRPFSNSGYFIMITLSNTGSHAARHLGFMRKMGNQACGSAFSALRGREGFY